MTTPPDPDSPEVRPPFWRHRYYYLVLKYAVLLLAVLFVLRLLRGLWS
jgi:hypothetical protein